MSVDWDASVLIPCHDIAFGEPATFTSVGGAPMPVVGMFFDGYTRNVDLADDVGVTTVKPVFVVRTEQFTGALPLPKPLPKQNDKLSVTSANTTYVIKDAQPDGVGELRLELQKVSSP
ncbi:hypothetical protein [Caballeronia sp. dw_19]|uniref:head-tail joining protein n=1 Tax=Caballeronia sp. dw_19 TaxID=2719791 RepID=UPI001BCDC483|nr:hypothetical protein [Caballeronia sp. dw_19]